MDIIDLRRVKPPNELGAATRRLLLPIMVPLAALYGGVTRLRRAVPIHAADAGVEVISVGSLAVGGTGKTPVCMRVAQRFRDAGRRVCILSRGYRRKSRRSPVIVSDGRSVLAGVEEAGDEPYMMARRLDGVGVVVGRDRLKSAETARGALRSDLVILDDGFQVRNLARKADVVCLDGETLRGGNGPLPWGTLREGWSAIEPGHLVLVRLDDRSRLPSARELARLGQAEVFYWARSEPALLGPDLKRIDPDEIDEDGFALVSGIAKPATFERSCTAVAAVRVSIRYGDHHWYSLRDAERIRDAMDRYRCNRILTTEKDIWKLPASLRGISLILASDPDFLDQESFWDALDRRITVTQ
jgi:tetraacyldisaccharide 4'-kinase